jgi:phage-related protein
MKTVRRIPLPVYPARSKTSPFAVILGMGLATVGVMVAVNGKVSTLSCSRPNTSTVECNLQESDLLNLHVTQISLGLVKSAELIVDLDYNGEIDRLFLVTEKYKVPLDFFSQHENLKEPADRINDFINDREEQYLEIKKDNRWFSCFFGAMFLLTGLVRIGNLVQPTARS